MAENKSTSILDKIADVTIDHRSFTNDQSEIIEFDRITLHVMLDGQEEKIECTPAKAEGKSAYKVLKIADKLE